VILRLIEEAEAATRFRDCDSVRPRILTDKTYQSIIESSQYLIGMARFSQFLL